MKQMFKILSVSADAKTRKGEKFGWLTGIVYLAPSDESGVMNVCPYASAGCRAACLYTAGMGKFPNVQAARKKKTEWFFNDRAGFLAQLKKEIAILEAVAKSEDKKCAVRFNGTSDLPLENFGIISEFPNVQFYDYTKNPHRMARPRPANYHLTFSRSEENDADVEKVSAAGYNVAVVFAGKTLPSHYLGREVVSGDESDLRFLDKQGVIIGLTTKGRAKRDTSGFVVNPDTL